MQDKIASPDHTGSVKEWHHAYDSERKRKNNFQTLSGIPLEPVYGPDDAENPGVYPFTRGPYASMYRTKLWTMRMFAGFGRAEDTNERFLKLIANGQSGLSVAFDLPTLMGRDSDDPRSEGEVGRCGVAVDTLEDMKVLFKDIDLGSISTSMTINGPAIALLAMYIAVAEMQGVKRSNLAGTIQADILKEYQAQKEYIFPPRPSVRLVSDMISFCAQEMPLYHPVSISGYHIREAGATAVEELAFTLSNGFAYVEEMTRRGMNVDEFAPRLSFFFNSHIDFFEEIAKLRAARRIWARWMKEHYHAKNPLSMRCRFHVQTAGCSLTATQAEVNIARTAIEAMAGVLGGTQSLHTNSMDEVLSLPTEKAARIALRTQQVIAYETGVAEVADPLGGSWYIESLTDEIERRAEEIFSRILEMGDGSILEGAYAGIEQGWYQRIIAESAYRQEQRISSKERIIVGVNDFLEGNDEEIPMLVIGQESETAQAENLRRFKSQRDSIAITQSLETLKICAARNDNLVPPIIEAVKAGCTVEETMNALAEVFGTYEEPVFT
ncbi:MAG: methylmalonyl-CoA mutase family protein [Actinobacteria bacterium]|nr:methylmalonyl-CoA mutase family protein [Actinomycetota bacterium]